MTMHRKTGAIASTPAYYFHAIINLAMKFTATSALERIKHPVNGDLLQRATQQERRLVMHCEPLQESNRRSSAVGAWLNWVGSILPKDKFERFKSLVQYPLETVDSTEAIFDELKKYQETPDADTRFEFRNSTYEQDFLQYLEEINDEAFWSNEAFRALRTSINSFIVVDVPATQQSLRPEPYCFIVGIEDVYDAMINTSNGKLEYIAYYENPRTIIFIDEVAWRRFERDDIGDWKIVTEAIHTNWEYTQAEGLQPEVWGNYIDGIGEVPACSFYNTIISKKENPFDKKGPITSALSKLDWLLFWKTSKKYLDLYGAWPIIVSYEEKCEYKDEQGNACNSGFVNYEAPDLFTNIAGEPIRYKTCQKRCPVCETKGIIGPGSYWTVTPPRDAQEADLMENPIKIVEISNDKLEYGVSEIIRLENEIFLNSVGYLNSDPTKEAINEKQVKSQYESRQSILDGIRKNFDQVKSFVYAIKARIRYGDLFVRAEVFGGREYFLQSAEDIAAQYKLAKDAGLPQYEVARIREVYSKTKFRNNPVQAQRSMILAQLEPWPDLSLQQAQQLGLSTMFPNDFALKLNFASFINRFEREQLSIVEFGSLLPLSQKISIINLKLKQYVTEQQTSNPAPIARIEPR